MAAPVLAGIPLVYEMLVGAGILAGGAVTANKMQKEIQKTIDTNPGVIDEALKNIFMGPARDLINPKMLEEIQNVKPTTTDQGTVKMKAMETEVSPEDQGMFIASPEQRAFLFGTRDTPSGTVLAPDAADIEAQRKEAAPKPLVTPMPKEQQDQTLSTPTPGQIKTETETFPAQEPQQQNIGTPVPEVVDTSILTKDLTVENIQNKIKYKKSKQDKNITEAYLGDKKIAEIRKDMDSEKTGNQFDYTINWTNEKGEIDYDDYDIETGFNSAKYTTALGFVNNSKSQEKEYLNKFIKAVENKDYDTLNKIREEERGYDFEDSEFRSKEFKDTIDKYRPDLIKLSTEAYNEQQEAIKETLNKTGSPVENLTEDQSVNLKGLVSRSVGQEKGMKAIREIYNDDNFLDILNPDQQKYINNLEYSYVGGVGDLGNPIIPHIFDNPMLEQNQEYMQDYQQKLANLLEKNLGKKFPVYRLMDKKTALAIVTGDLPDIKTLQEDPETGESVLKEYTFEGPFGKQTIPQEFMGFSLSPKEALAFRDFSFSGARGKKDEDFVLMEYTTIPTNAVMRGHEGEKEIVFRTVDSPLSSFELYDIKFTKEEDKRDVQLKKNKDFENLKKRFNK